VERYDGMKESDKASEDGSPSPSAALSGRTIEGEVKDKVKT
jgi:hypothetical protein